MFQAFSFRKSVAKIFSIALLLVNQLAPVASIIQPTPAYAQTAEASYAQSQSAVTLNFVSASNSFDLTVKPAEELDYTLTYTHDNDLQESLQGHQQGEKNRIKASIYAGTCSNQDCTPHHHITGGTLELKIKVGNTFELKTVQFSINNDQTWVKDAQGAYTLGPVEANKTYLFPENKEVSVEFHKLPAEAGFVKIAQYTLTPAQIKAWHVLGDKAYEVTSDMADGTFTYDLQLPYSKINKTQPVTIKYAESLTELSSAKVVEQPVKSDTDSVEVSSLNHFTIFITVDPHASSTSGDDVGWDTPTFIQHSDDLKSTAGFPDFPEPLISSTLYANNFGLAIPDKATIEGFVARIERSVDANPGVNAHDYSVRLMKLGTPVSANKAIAADFPTTDTYQEYGGPTDLWGTTWTPADVNEYTFGIAYQASREAAPDGQDLFVDHMQLIVNYLLVNLTSPVGGESYVGGTVHPITWNVPQDPIPSVDPTTIDLAYTTDSINFTTIATGLPNTGSYDWTTPLINSDTVKVKVTVHEGTYQAEDVSPAVFSIHSAIPDPLLFWVEENNTTTDLGWQDLGQWYTYNIYRDGVLIDNVTGTSYTDNIAGTHLYEVRSLSIGTNEHESIPQTPKQAAPHQFVIDDNSMTPDSQTTGTFSKTGNWGAYTVNDGGYAASVLQNAVGGDSWSIAGAAAGQTATWTTSNTLNGFYDIYVQYICDGSRGTAAYDVYSGGFKRNASRILINQATTDGVTACGAQSTQSENGPVWVKLGRFSIFQNQASVVMTARDGEINMVADAVAFDFAGPAGVIQGRKFNDVNGNGFFDCSEKCIPVRPNLLNNWTIHLFDNLWNSLDSMNTGDDSTVAGNVAKGQYRFVGLEVGEYYVCEDPQAGWMQTRPFDSMGSAIADPNHPGYYCYVVKVGGKGPSAFFRRGRSFGNFQLGSISGYKWNDLNSNAAWDKTEPGLANWTIFIDSNDNGILDNQEQSTVTDINGSYTLANLPPGDYTICEQRQTNWNQIFPANNACQTVSITTSGQEETDINFGNHYVEPTHGGGGNGGGGSNGGGGPANPPVCTADAPSTAPANLRITGLGANTVTLAWNPVTPVTHYALVFTRNSDGAQYGSTDIGNTTSYTITGLSGQDSYTFEVFGVNGCKPGDRARVASKVSGRILTSRPTGSDGDVLGQTVEVKEASASASVVDVKPEVLGTSQSCSNPWWKWLGFLAQGVILVVLAGFLRKRHRGNWLIAGLLTTLVVIAVILIFFCSLWPWILIAAAVSFIGLVVAVVWHDEPEIKTPVTKKAK